MKRQNRWKRRVVRSLAVLLCMMLCQTFFFVAAENEEKIVKVGSFLYDGFLGKSEDGDYSGYGFDYLQAIAQYTGWQYEFVDASFQDSLEMLEKGEIDLMGTSLKTPQREEVYDFSSLAMGSGYGVLATNLENDVLPFDDFDAFDGLRVGAVQGNQQAAHFLAYSQTCGFTPQMLYYDSQQQMQSALDSGEIDAIVMTSVLRSPDLRIVAKFGQNDFFFITTKGNSEVLSGLNSAMEQIQLNNPYFNSELNRKYFDLQASTLISFTRQELEYIQSCGPIQCVYNPAAQPISFRDAKTGEFRGISADICKLLQERTGLTFAWLDTNTYAQAMEMFTGRQAALFVGATHDFSWAQKYGAVLTNSYLDGQTVMVTNGKAGEKPVVALYDQTVKNEIVSSMTADAAQVNQYGGIAECLDALRSGSADTTFVNSTIMSYHVNNPKYTRLQITQLYGSPADTCIAVNENEDPMLVSILNKVLGNISNSQRNEIVYTNMKADYFNSFTSYLYARPLDFVLLVSVILLIITAALLLLLRNRIKNAGVMKKMLYTDALTGYQNYKALTEAAPKLLGAAPQKYALLYMDMKQFKYINDTFGYEMGDRVLCAIAEILRDFVDEQERFARVYADKFVLLLQVEDLETFHGRLEDLSSRLSGLSDSVSENIHFIFSCGIYRLHKDDSNIDMACDRANYAKDTAQNLFSNTFVFYDELMRTQILSEKALESSMRPALEKGEFVPYFQPKVNVLTGEVTGVEALVRWEHPEQGVLSPALFIPFFEKNGFVINIDLAIFEQVCRNLRAWMDAGNKPVPASVNFSRRHMLDPRFAQKLTEVTQRYGVSPGLLEIEITETIALENLDMAVEFALSLKECGFMISIDDYGTGYSSIAFLQKLPLDVLKLDKSFLENAMQSKKARDIMRHLITAVRDNQIRVLCEGIETEEQKNFIISQNCCFAQGYLYSKPLAQEAFEAYLKQRKIASHEYLDVVPTVHVEEYIRSGAEDFLDRVMPGWVLGCYLEEGYPIFHISPQMLSSLGYSESAFAHETGGLFVNCLHPEDLQSITQQMERNNEGTDEYLLQYRMRKKDGGYLWIRDVGKKIVTDQGKEALLCVCTDITDMVQLQHEKDAVISAIPGGVCELLVTLEGPVIQSATDPFYKCLGHSREEMARMENRLFAVVYESDLPMAKENMRKAAADGCERCECMLRIRYPDDTLHWLYMRGTIRDADRGKLVTVVGYNVDDEMQAREDAQVIKAKMELALRLTDHAVFAYDIAAKTIYEQNGLYEYCPPEINLQNIPQSAIESGFVHPDDAQKCLEMYDKIAAGEPHASCEMRIRGVKAAERAPYVWVHTILSTIYGKDGRPVKAVGIIEGIEQRKQVEYAFAQEGQYREALAAASILSYDVNLNKNTFDRISGSSMRRLNNVRDMLAEPNSYYALIASAVQTMLAAEDRERFLCDMNAESLLELYKSGVTEREYEYRRLLPDGISSWVSATLYLLPDRISGDIMCFVYYRDIQARKSMEESLKYHATRDALTGLFNRASGELQIREFLDEKKGEDGIHAVLMIDVDRFKNINDTYGHQYGDEYLAGVAKSITSTLRSSDIIVRMGGDEFVVLIKDLRDEETAGVIAEKISRNITDRGRRMNPPAETAVSIGIAIAPRQGEDFDALYRHADTAMYYSKKSPTFHIAIYDGQSAVLPEKDGSR